MKLKYFLSIVFLGLILNVNAQKYITKSGRIIIVSKSQIFNVNGVNENVASILNTSTGELVISMLIRSFEFEEAVMEERFNVNYLESKDFPKSIFKGQISNFGDIDFKSDGIYRTKVEGKLTIHGVTRDVEEKGLITITNGIISAKSEFFISLTDFEIEIERALKSSIDEEVLLKIDFTFTKY